MGFDFNEFAFCFYKGSGLNLLFANSVGRY
jgi:hypothetical protein